MKNSVRSAEVSHRQSVLYQVRRYKLGRIAGIAGGPTEDG
jgi:hypothetical protein